MNGRFASSNGHFTDLHAFDEVWFAGLLSDYSSLDHTQCYYCDDKLVILSNPIKWIAQGPDYEYALIHVSLKILVFFEATYLVQFLEVISI